MLKRTLFLCVAVSASLASAGSDKTEWQNRYDTVLMQISKGNLKGYKASFAPGFIQVGPDGKKMTREQFLGMVEKDLMGAKSFVPKVMIKKINKRGSITDVSFDFTAVVTNDKGKFKVHEVGTDSWKMIGMKWMMVKTVDKSFSYTPVK